MTQAGQVTEIPLGLLKVPQLRWDKAAVSHVLTEDESCLHWLSGARLPTVQQSPPTEPWAPRSLLKKKQEKKKRWGKRKLQFQTCHAAAKGGTWIKHFNVFDKDATFGTEQSSQRADFNLMETLKDFIYFLWWSDYESESHDIHNIIIFQI